MSAARFQVALPGRRRRACYAGRSGWWGPPPGRKSVAAGAARLGRVDDCAELVHAVHAQVGDGEGAALPHSHDAV